VNVAHGVVWLRGEARTPQLIKLAEARAAEVPEVTKVENLLHLPKTPAPSRTDTPPRQRKTQRSPKSRNRSGTARPVATATRANAQAACAVLRRRLSGQSGRPRHPRMTDPHDPTG